MRAGMTPLDERGLRDDAAAAVAVACADITSDEFHIVAKYCPGLC